MDDTDEQWRMDDEHRVVGIAQLEHFMLRFSIIVSWGDNCKNW